MHDQQKLNKYFGTYWAPYDIPCQHSRYDRIAANIDPGEWVLDVGCGSNRFKSLLPNVVGIDPAFDEADHKCTIEQYQPDRLFDVAIILGSINFGIEETIAKQIDKVISCLKPQSRIYWRLNPGRRDHKSIHCQEIDFFPWSHQKLKSFADKHGFEQSNEQVESDEQVVRLYAEWRR